MTQNMTKNTILHITVNRLLLLLLMMTIGATGAWGQPGTDYSGKYYIAFGGKQTETAYSINTPNTNYYLCPTEGWICYVDPDNYTNPADDNGKPFLTTYQCKNPSNNYDYENKAVWTIIKNNSENLYYIKHGEKYLVLNGTINTAATNRIRVHLETLTSEALTNETQNNKALFEITPNKNGGMKIRPKNTSGYWINVTNGNQNSLVGVKGKNDGPDGYKWVDGTIGIWNAENYEARCYLEDIIIRPTISKSSGSSVTITYPESATIYYTTDGSDPTDSENTNRLSFTGTSETVSFTNVAVVKAAAYIGGEYSNIATFVYVHTGSGNPYLLQSVDNTNFYMVAGDNNNSSKPTVNTSSLPQAGMSWHFEDAGIVNGVQCYYVYNTSATGYLRRDGNSFYIESTYANDNNYKFAVIPYLNESGILAGFYLYNIGKAQFVYKGTSNNVVGNGSDGAVNLTTTFNQDLARWNLILVANKSFPSPVTLSDNSSATYYTLASSETPAQLITPPTGTSTYVKTSNGENDNQKWYFKEAGTDGWASYYYILNAVTGEAMYFGKEAASTTISDALEMGPLPETPTDNYKFALAHTVTDGEYYIVPKPLAQFTKTKYTAVWYVNTTTSLQTQSNRANIKIKWQINEQADYVAPPVITYNPGTGIVTITCTTPGATIHYTNDGSDPTESSTSYSEGGFPLGSASTIKAIAVKGSSSSNMTTKTFINGLYYIKHATNDYRMYPSTTTDGSGNPRVTTKTLKDEEAIWEIRQQGDYYTIKHYTDSKYMWTADATVKTNTVHLATAADTNDDKLLYEFTPVASLSGVYTIRPKNAANEDSKNFLDTTSGDNGTNTIGLYNSGNGIRWELVTIPMQPVITVNDIDVTITNTLGDIIYTTDGTNPIESTTATTVTANSTTMTLNYGKEYTVRAISRYTDREATPNNHYSAESTETVEVGVEPPVISVSGTNVVTISTEQPHSEKITIRYNYDETANNPADPTTSTGTVWDGTTFSLTDGKAYTIKAIAYTEEGSSVVRSLTVNLKGAEPLHSLADITDQAGNYYFATDFTASNSPSDGIGASSAKPFKGKIDGKFIEISLDNSPLFEYVEDATIKNVIISSASVSTSGHAGAIANVASGETRIYNCGLLDGTVSGSNYVGGIVGLLDGYSRVINCFSYADITGGNKVGGIVGYNNYASTADDLRTMVMNCMFYGDITGGTDKAPIYNGEIISNKDATGVGNYNYFLAEATFTDGINTYNCALMAEKRFLQRFEFFRHLLNSHLELAGWWATGTFSKTEMAKWVFDPNQIGTATPYPILKAQGKYPSVVNYDAESATTQTERNKGGKLGTLTVNIQMGSGGAVYAPPTGASITTSSLTLNITDKDPDHFNFNYYKVQLPYYNNVGTKNYTGYRVVTGWKIVSITGGTAGSFTTGADATTDANGKITSTPYNFADRNCTNKDLYGTGGSNRVFNQGAYWDVPEGVTAITIEPYWAKCAFLADPNADKVYDQDMTTEYNVPNIGGGQIYSNGNSYSIAGESQVVHTTMGNAISSSNSTGLFVGVTATNHTVYDYAVVLVGNYHHYGDMEASTSKPYTVTSVDLDGDNEPDYSYILRFDGRKGLHPVRVDFLNVPGLGMAQKSTDGTGSYNFGIMQPLNWFEVTNTALFRVTQMEYEHQSRGAKPLILHGGVIEQWVSGQSGGNGQLTTYIHVGSNVWFKEFHLGCHQDSKLVTKHPPVSVTGGDYNEFYLTGLYSSADNCNDNAECYINGGRFDKVAGTGIEGIGDATNHTNGNIVWQIQNADIEEFYGGGINAAKPIEGSITTVITGSHVKRFCGGPKFGDMNTGQTVTTTATNCTFVSFFGAGYGGNSYYRAAPANFTSQTNYEWNKWVAGTVKGNVTPPGSTKGNYPNGDIYSGYDQTYNSHFGGVSTRFDYQFLPQSDNVNNVGRLFIDFVKFSLATTHNVTSTLTGCTITGNFYGGGSLGKVDGTVTSTLTNCTVHGSAFGGGYDATRPKVQVMNTSKTGSIDGFLTPPKYDTNTGSFISAAEPYNTSTEYRWEHSATVNSTATAIDKNEHILYTTADLTTLGQVTGNVILNISGNTLVEGQAVDYEGNPTGGDRGGVFGGGDASAVLGNTTVTINATALQDGATYNAYCVYGGGNSAPVGGNSTVTLQGNTKVHDNVFGGGNEGEVSGNTTVNIQE